MFLIMGLNRDGCFMSYKKNEIISTTNTRLKLVTCPTRSLQ